VNQNTQTKCNKDILRKCSMALYCVSFRNENERGIIVSKKKVWLATNISTRRYREGGKLHLHKIEILVNLWLK